MKTLHAATTLILAFCLLHCSCQGDRQRSYYPNGQLKSRLSQERLLETYYSNGNLESRFVIDSVGMQWGPAEYYHENGRLKLKCQYENGYKLDSSYEYDSEGKLVAAGFHGGMNEPFSSIVRYENGKPYAMEEYFFHYLFHDIQQRSDGLVEELEYDFLSKEKTSLTLMYPDGEVIADSSYYADISHELSSDETSVRMTAKVHYPCLQKGKRKCKVGFYDRNYREGPFQVLDFEFEGKEFSEDLAIPENGVLFFKFSFEFEDCISKNRKEIACFYFERF